MDAPPVQYVRTSDGYHIAYCVSGQGIPLVLMPFPFNHLHLLWRSQSSRVLYESLAVRFRLVQYDSRGMGMSTRGLKGNHTIDHYLFDLEAVLQVAGVERFLLAGGFVFSNVALRYTLAHPERVRGLVLLDSGVGDAWNGIHHYEQLARENWPAFVRFLAGSMAGTTLGSVHYFSETITQENFLALLKAIPGTSLDHRLPEIRVPALVIGAGMPNSDVFIENARRVATLLPDARLALYEDFPAHIFSLDGGVPPIVQAIDNFVRGLPEEAGGAASPSILSAREMDVLRLLAAGRSNPQIAGDLVISPNTVAKHVTSILTKTGAANRVEAAVYAKDHGLV